MFPTKGILKGALFPLSRHIMLVCYNYGSVGLSIYKGVLLQEGNAIQRCPKEKAVLDPQWGIRHKDWGGKADGLMLKKIKN